MFEESISKFLKLNTKEYLLVRENCKEDGWWKCLSLGSVIIISEAEIWVSNWLVWKKV